MSNWHKVPLRIDDSMEGLMAITGLCSKDFNMRIYFIKLDDEKVQAVMVITTPPFPQVQTKKVFDTLELANIEAEKVMYLFFHSHRNQLGYEPERYYQDFEGWSNDNVINWLSECGAFDVTKAHKIEVK